MSIEAIRNALVKQADSQTWARFHAWLLRNDKTDEFNAAVGGVCNHNGNFYNHQSAINRLIYEFAKGEKNT